MGKQNNNGGSAGKKTDKIVSDYGKAFVKTRNRNNNGKPAVTTSVAKSKTSSASKPKTATGSKSKSVSSTKTQTRPVKKVENKPVKQVRPVKKVENKPVKKVNTKPKTPVNEKPIEKDSDLGVVSSTVASANIMENTVNESSFVEPKQTVNSPFNTVASQNNLKPATVKPVSQKPTISQSNIQTDNLKSNQKVVGNKVITITKRKMNLGTKIFIFCMLIVPLINFAIFTIYANLGGAVLAFFRRNDAGEVVFAGIYNFKLFFTSFGPDGYGQIILVSFGYLFVVMFISLPISTLVSFFLYKKVPFSKVIVVILFMPNILPLSILASYYRELFDPNKGVLTYVMNFLFNYRIDNAPYWLSYPFSNWMLYLYTVYFGFGYNSILIWGAMTRIPQEVVESAELDGANLWVEFFHITIPITWPTMSMVIVLTWMVPFTVYMQPLLIKFNGQDKTTTYSLLTLQKLKDANNPYYAAVLSLLSAAVSLPTTLLLRKLLDKCFSVVEI